MPARLSRIEAVVFVAFTLGWAAVLGYAVVRVVGIVLE